MRVAKIMIGDKEYPIVYSAHVLCEAEAKFGGIKEMFAVLTENPLGEKFKALAWLASVMMESAQEASSACGGSRCFPPSADEIMHLVGIDDISSIQQALMSAIVGDVRREVEAEPQKNAESTPDPA